MSDLRGNNAPAKMRMGSTGKIVGALVVALAIGGIGAYTYTTWKPHPNQVVASNQLPSPSQP